MGPMSHRPVRRSMRRARLRMGACAGVRAEPRLAPMQTPQSSRAAALDLGRIGLWSVQVRFQPPEIGAEAVAEAEALGFKTVWVPGGVDSGVLGDLDRLLDATSKLKFGTGILNIWKHE